MSIRFERSEQEEKAYYLDRLGYLYCVACAWKKSGKPPIADSPEIEGLSVVWGDIANNECGCDKCGKKESAFIISGIATVEHPVCKIF